MQDDRIYNAEFRWFYVENCMKAQKMQENEGGDLP